MMAIARTAHCSSFGIAGLHLLERMYPPRAWATCHIARVKESAAGEGGGEEVAVAGLPGLEEDGERHVCVGPRLAAGSAADRALDDERARAALSQIVVGALSPSTRTKATDAP